MGTTQLIVGTCSYDPLVANNVMRLGSDLPDFHKQKATRKKVHDFLVSHTAYELIPESGKVVVIDIDFSVRQAFHALHEQSISSAPLWDSRARTIVGIISASDFIQTLKHLRHTVSAGSNPLSESEMDAHTIRCMRDEAAENEHLHPKALIYAKPSDSFHSVVKVLVENRCSVAPILSVDPLSTEAIPTVLHIASISGVLACLMRHFRASLASLPLLQQPLGSMPIGTWSPNSPIGQQGAHAHSGSEWQSASMRVAPIHTVTPDTLLTTALSMLLEAGVSSLPVVDAQGVLLDVYARGDITLLTKGNAYNRLQWEDLTVGQALTLSGAAKSSTSQSQSQSGAAAPQTEEAPASAATGAGEGSTSSEVQVRAASKCTRLFVCTRQDALRLVLERLSMPAVRRVIVVHPETTEVEAIVSLSDVAKFLFL